MCTPERSLEGERGYGLGGNVVKKLTRHITGHHHTVYCDNFFTRICFQTSMLVAHTITHISATQRI
jgi:hypothetical protein